MDRENTKTYTIDDRRRSAALAACDGLPTEMLERGVVKQMYSICALLIFADRIAGEIQDGKISFSFPLWEVHMRSQLDVLSNLSDPGRVA